MALFGDLGKAIGLDNVDTGDALALAGTAAGFYFGGPAGAALGSGIGSLAGGKSVNDALTNAALAYGVTNFVSPNLMSSSAQTSTSNVFGPTGVQKSLYGVPTAQQAATQTAGLSTGIDELSTAPMDSAAKDTGLGSFFKDMDTSDYLLAGSLGLGALGAFLGPEEKESGAAKYFFS